MNLTIDCQVSFQSLYPESLDSYLYTSTENQKGASSIRASFWFSVEL